MTYIAAFRCREGFVCCADTQETEGFSKNYVQKLAAFGNGDAPYPFVLGGAGAGELVDALTQEISESLLRDRPVAEKALKVCIKAAIDRVYDEDVPLMGLGRNDLGAQLLIAVNVNYCDSDFRLIWTKGKRVFLVSDGKAIIGYSTAANKTLLDRLHRPEISMSQAVILAALLVSQSKHLDAYVGGETSIGIVTQFVALIEDQDYVHLLELRAERFLPVSDTIFLSLTDAGLSKAEFEKKLKTIVDLLLLHRQWHIQECVDYLQARANQGILFQSHPYSKFPMGGRFTFTLDPTTGMYVVTGTDQPSEPATQSDSQTSEGQR